MLEREPQGYWPGECLKCGLEDKDMDNVFSWSGNCKSCGTSESYGRYNQFIKKDAESFGAECKHENWERGETIEPQYIYENGELVDEVNLYWVECNECGAIGDFEFEGLHPTRIKWDAESFAAQYIEMDCDPHHKWKLNDTPYIDYGDGSSGFIELSVRCQNCGEERFGSYSINENEPCALDLSKKGVKPRYYRWGAESFSVETGWTNCEQCGASTNHNMMLTRED
jgi:hypothetical protein